VAGRDEQVGVVVVDDDEGEVALQLVVRASDRLGEVAVVVALDQVDDGLGVGLRAEGVAFCDQPFAELAVVLDDPVQDDRQLRVLAAGQRVRVRLADAAVSRPARVPEAVARGGAVRPRGGLEVLQVADGADVVEPVRLAERDPGRVVAAVLETLEPVEEQLLALPRPDVSDDPAHPRLLFPNPPRRNRPREREKPGNPAANVHFPQRRGLAELPLY
jgi:hypothetical protein